MDQEAVNALESTQADLAEASRLLSEYHRFQRCPRRKSREQQLAIAARLDNLRAECRVSYKEWISASASREAKRILRSALMELRELTFE